MMPDNRFYGHDDILRGYCGLRTRVPIPGRLQHGWTFDAGLADQYMRAPYPKYVWSRRNLDMARAAGFRGVIPIGAPFLYLPPAAEPPSAGGRSVLAFPFHGTDANQLQGDMEAYARSLEQLQRDGFGPITVCMYYLEHRQPALRAAFEQRGLPVTTAGPRDGNPGFLLRLRELILSHAFTTANRISTATFYALVLSRPFFLNGPPMTLKKAEADPTGARFASWQGAEFPDLTYARFDGSVRAEIGRRELGAEFKLQPEVMRELFAWRISGIPLHAIRWAQHLTNYTVRKLRGIPTP